MAAAAATGKKRRLVKTDCPAGPVSVVQDQIPQTVNVPPSGQRFRKQQWSFIHCAANSLNEPNL